MTPDSRTSLIQDQTLYSTSDSDNEFTYRWIQEPIGRQAYDNSVKLIIEGVYIRTELPDLPILDSVLSDEFARWEAASDEDFLNFEKENH